MTEQQLENSLASIAANSSAPPLPASAWRPSRPCWAAIAPTPPKAAHGGLPGLPHFAPKAKRVVVLWQGGGPSHVDLFDDKPVMRAMAGRDIPDSVRGTTRLSTMSASYARWPCVPSIKPFRRYGQSGLSLSEMLPNVGAMADEICVVRSMYTEAVNHAPGVTFFMTGSQVPGPAQHGRLALLRPGQRGGQSADVRGDDLQRQGQTCGQLFFDYYWGSGFLPSRFQGVRFRNTGDLVPYLANPPGREPGIAAGAARRHRRHERRPPGRLRRSRNRHAHCPVRNGLSHADQRAGSRRFLQRIASDARPLWPGCSEQGHVREQLPDRPPTCWSGACGSCS